MKNLISKEEKVEYLKNLYIDGPADPCDLLVLKDLVLIQQKEIDEKTISPTHGRYADWLKVAIQVSDFYTSNEWGVTIDVSFTSDFFLSVGPYDLLPKS